MVAISSLSLRTSKERTRGQCRSTGTQLCPIYLSRATILVPRRRWVPVISHGELQSRSGRWAGEKKVKTYVDLVVERAVLRDRDEAGLVVRRGVDGRELVGAGRETVGHIGGDGAVRGGGRVDALKEREDGGVQDRGRPERIDGLHDEMRVADDVALTVDLLRRRIIVLVRVDKVARLQVLERHRDRERGVGLDGAQVGRGDEFGGGHVRAARDHAHRSRVARTALDLLSVRERQVDGEAEVDKVVVRGQRGDLARFRVALSVIFEPRGDHAGV